MEKGKNRQNLILYALQAVAGPDRGKTGRADRRMDCTFAMKEVSRVQSKRAQAYQKLVERLSPKSDMAKGIFRAYWVGGAICVLGQLINDLFSYGLKWGMQSASTATSICLIFIGVAADRVGRV